LEFDVVLGFSVIALILAILTYTIYRFLKGIPDLLLEFSEDLIQEVSKSEELQKNVYMIGGLLGNGIKGGVGLAGGGRSPSLKQLGTGLIGSFIENMISRQVGNPPPSLQASYPPPTQQQDKFFKT
jgi:hypothetical protein